MREARRFWRPPPVLAYGGRGETLPPMLKRRRGSCAGSDADSAHVGGGGRRGVWLRELAPRPQWHAYSTLPIVKPRFAPAPCCRITDYMIGVGRVRREHECPSPEARSRAWCCW